jgi:hypothetical protein
MVGQTSEVSSPNQNKEKRSYQCMYVQRVFEVQTSLLRFLSVGTLKHPSAAVSNSISA